MFWKPDTVAKIGTQPVRADLIPFGATVTAVDGDWLWVQRAWIRKSDVHSADEALDFYTAQLENDPNDAVAYCRRGTVWKHKRQFARALADFDQALDIDPNNASAYASRASVRENLGQHELAVQDCSRAIALDRRCAVAYLNRGIAHAGRGDLQAAIVDFTTAIGLDPTDGLVYRNRGVVRSRLGQYELALADYREALRFDPSSADAYNDAAWLRATCAEARWRDGGKALANAKLACQLSEWKNWRHLGTLAAAYAEQGDYDRAIDTQKQALALMPAEADRQIEQRHLEQFQSRWPWREDLFPRRSAFRGLGPASTW